MGSGDVGTAQGSMVDAKLLTTTTETGPGNYTHKRNNEGCKTPASSANQTNNNDSKNLICTAPCQPFSKNNRYVTTAPNTTVATARTTKMMQLQQPKTKNKTNTNKKKKPKGLTTPQRVAWAHTHYVVHHHGTAADALQFLNNKRKVDNTPIDALVDLRKMCPPKLPTWEEAKVNVFDSTINDDDSTVIKLSSSGSDNNTADTPTKRTRLPDLPTWKEAKAKVFDSSCSDENSTLSSSQHNMALATPTSARLPSTISFKTSTESPYNPNPSTAPVSM